MNNINRHQRLRNLLKNLNRERKKQAKQIDILCNDIISAQRDFIKRLKVIDFRANFYESIMGATDLNCLLSAAAAIIKDETNDANITFFLRQNSTSSAEPGVSFEIYTFDDENDDFTERPHIESFFTPELMNNICLSNKICKIEDMFTMGLQGNLTSLSTISAVTMPLGSAGSAQGFMLVYRSMQKKLVFEEIRKVSSITGGLSQAIYSCYTIMHSSD